MAQRDRLPPRFGRGRCRDTTFEAPRRRGSGASGAGAGHSADGAGAGAGAGGRAPTASPASNDSGGAAATAATAATGPPAKWRATECGRLPEYAAGALIGGFALLMLLVGDCSRFVCEAEGVQMAGGVCSKTPPRSRYAAGWVCVHVRTSC